MSKRTSYLWNRLVKIVLEIVKLAIIWVVTPPPTGWIIVPLLILIQLGLIKKEKVIIFLDALVTKLNWSFGKKAVLKLREKWLNKTP